MSVFYMFLLKDNIIQYKINSFKYFNFYKIFIVLIYGGFCFI